MLSAHRVERMRTLIGPDPRVPASEAELERLSRRLDGLLRRAVAGAVEDCAGRLGDTSGALWVVSRVRWRIRLPADCDPESEGLVEQWRAGLAEGLHGAMQGAWSSGRVADGVARFEDATTARIAAVIDALAGDERRAFAHVQLRHWPAAFASRPERLHTAVQALNRAEGAGRAPPGLQLIRTLRRRALLGAALMGLSGADWVALSVGLPGAAALERRLGGTPALAPGARTSGVGGPDEAGHGGPIARLHLEDDAASHAFRTLPILDSTRHGRQGVVAAWLALLEHAPSMLLGPAAGAALGRAADALSPVSRAAEAATGPALDRAPLPHASRPREAQGDRHAPAGPSRVEPASTNIEPLRAASAAALEVESFPTDRAGVLFLLRALPELLVGPDAPDLSRERLWHLAVRGLGLGAGDPAAAAFAGLHPAEVPSSWPLDEAFSRAEADGTRVRERVEAHLALARRPEEDPLDCAGLIARRGHLIYGDAAIECVLPLHEIDLRIRRVGLDVDPGWLPWLGRVVRFRFEEGLP